MTMKTHTFVGFLATAAVTTSQLACGVSPSERSAESADGITSVDPPYALASSILPGSRSVQVGVPATAFMAVAASPIQGAPPSLEGCAMQLGTPIPASFSYRM